MADNRFRFTNEKCPVCNNTFNPDDDIVVCPECGTPHHRECYIENKSCANSHKHSEEFRWEPDFIPLDETEITIPESKENNDYKQAMDMAQMPFPSIPVEKINPVFREKFGELEDGVSAEDVAIFVRQDAHRYVSKFKKITDGKVTWNWAAFFFSPYWFFYRKLHKIGAVIFALFILITSISFLPPVVQLNTDILAFETKLQEMTESADTDEEYQAAMLEIASEMSETVQKHKTGVILVISQSVASLVLSVLVGLKANKWYYNHTKSQLKTIKSESTSENYKSNLFIKGGVSYGSAFLVILAERAFFFALEMLLSAPF